MSILQQGQAEVSIDTPSSGFVRLFYNSATNQMGYRDSLGNYFYFAEGVNREIVEDLIADSFEDSTSITWVYNDALNFFQASIETSVLATINSALQSGDNVSELTNDADYRNGSQVTASVNAHANLVNNPHAVTKTQVGLSNVPNVDATLRANHTGTQTASTISDFASIVRSTILTGISFASTALVIASDSILTAIGKLQAQINAMVFGREYQYFEDLTTFTTNSGTNQNATTFTTSSLIGGTYRFSMQWNFTMNSTTSSVFFEMYIDGAIRNQPIQVEIKDSSDDITYSLFQRVVLASGTHTIQLRTRTENGATVSIPAIKCDLWRVS